MPNHKENGFTSANEQRKALLITQGAMFRSGIVASKQTVVSGLQAESLARSALKQIGLAAFSAWRGGGSGLATGVLPALLPALMGGLSSLPGLWRNPRWKPLLRGALVAGVTAAAAAFFLKRKKDPAAAESSQTTESADTQ